MDKAELNNYPDDLIIAYLDGDVDEKRHNELENWVSESPAHKRYLYEMTEIWLATASGNKSSGNKEAVYQRFKERISKKKKSRIYVLRFARVAASILVAIFLVGGGIYWGRNDNGKDPQEHFAFGLQSVEVPLGSKGKVLLSDGSMAWLNAGSKISYSSEFTEKERLVNLEGEAYFEVAHNADAPFVVNVEDAAVKVLGTKFNVKVYTDDETIEIILAEGSVEFVNQLNPSTSFIMKPGQQTILNKNDGSITVNEVSASLANNWIGGAHFFNELTFEQIARQLEKTFDVSIVFRNEDKKDLVFYADFRSDDSLDDILTIMARGNKFKYKKRNSIIEIY